MRAPLIAAVFLAALNWSPVLAANAPGYWDGDNYLECLIGKGAVAMRHGAKPVAAVDSVREACASALEPNASAEVAGDAGDYVDYVYGVAVDTLTAAADRGGIF